MKDSTSFDCDCGQEPITIVLVGCTQHGKSSVLRTLLDYAGDKDQADAVKTGNYGNASTTKECHCFPVTIKLRQHQLTDVDGKTLTVNSADDVEDLEELGDVSFDDDQSDFGADHDSGVRHVSNDSGRHIHLRIIDTPGLDDSDNANHLGSDAADLGISVPMRIEDEKHKMAILKAMALESKINSVCFVISTEQQFTKAVPKILREYKALFSSSGLGDNYHFLHTKVNPGNMWEKIKTQPAAVNRAFSTWTATHHFLNNLPVDPLSEYLSHRAIAEMLEALSEDAVQTVKRLSYPKTDAHRFIESYIREALEIDQKYYDKYVKSCDDNIMELQERQEALEARDARERENYLKINKELEALDTYELISLKPLCRRTHPAKWFTRSRVDFDISTDFPVRKIEKDPASPVYCDWHGSSDEYWKGECRYRQSMVCRDSNRAIAAQVELFGWKKEIEGSRIKTLTAEKGEALEEWNKTVAELQKIKKEMDEAKTARETNETASLSTALRKMRLREDTISCQVIKTRGQYLATTSLISYGFGLGVTDNSLFKFQLPENVDAAATERAKTKYTAKLKAFTSMLERCDAMIKDLTERGQMLERLGSELDEMVACIKLSLNKTMKARTRCLEGWVSPISDADRRTGRETLDQALAALRDEFEPVLDHGQELAMQAIHDHAATLREKKEFIRAAGEKTGEILASHQRAVEKWETKRFRVKTSLMAAKAMLEVAIQRDRSSPARFAALKRGIDTHGASSDKVWDGMFYELCECYRNDPENWEQFLSVI
ncbi:hypothetical protein F66182_6169 [Fusarium sp. NRRL 66182]|nr:hypothetical protein F66182_6169 [Fusarium sp. NRRL 66182]